MMTLIWIGGAVVVLLLAMITLGGIAIVRTHERQ